ncbi:MAG: PKD domain-containing protein [Chitinophagaceae bacterium]|nr:PKD domain-containing protein [Chitinophagaceae bacterium]
MKRIILFLATGLLIFINSFAGDKEKNTLAAVAGFNASVTTGCAPLAVQFTSTSTSDVGDPIISYTWNFGDGTIITNTDPNPQHTYNSQGTFTVVLTINTEAGSTNTKAEAGYIQTFEKFTPNLGPDATLCAGSIGVGYLLQTNVPGGLTYTWDDPSSNGNPSRYVSSTGTYWVEVGNGTCTARDTVNVVVTASFAANFNYTVLDNCGSMQVQFNNLTTQCGANDLEYSWSIYGPSGSYDWYGDENPVHTFTEEGDYEIELNVYDPNTGDGDGIIIPFTVAFSSGPATPDLGGDKTICAGNSVQLDAGYEEGVTYSWSPAAGLSNPNIYNPVATPAGTTTYTVTKSKCGVDEVASINITVNPAFTVNLGPDQETCGGVITFNTGITGATSIVWGGTVDGFGNGFTNSPTAPTNLPGTYWVSVVKDGCEARDTIVVHSKPSVHAEFSYAQTSFCVPYSVKFTDMSAINCGSLSTYIWDFGDGTVITRTPPTTAQKNPTHNYAATGSYAVSLIVANNNGKSDTFSVVINVTGSGPSVDLGPDRALCAGSSTTLDAGNAGATYLWSTGETTQTIDVTTSDTYYVTVTNGACSDRDTITVSFSSAPAVVSLGPDRNICTGTSTILDAGNAGSTFLWSTGETTQTISVNTGGNYSVIVGDGSCTGGDDINITVSGVPPVVNLGADQNICAGGSITLDAGNAGSGYLWSTGETTQTINVTTTGTYSVTVSNGSCSADDDINITVNTSTLNVNLGNDTTLCSGGTLTLDAGNAGATYLWSTGETSQTIIASSTGSYWVEVSNGSCFDRDTINVTINTTPLVVNLGPDAEMACGVYTINSGVSGASSIIWGSNPVIPELEGYNTAFPPRSSISILDPATYWVTVVKDGCTARDTIVITAKKQVDANFIYSQTVNCPPYSVKFTSDGYTTFACGTRRNFTWDFGDGTVVTYASPPAAGALQRNPVHDYAAAGTYNVTLIVTNSNNKADTVTIPVTVTGSGIDINLGNDTTICTGTTLTLDAGNHPGATYAWSTGESFQTIDVTTSGTYSVTVSNGICNAVDNIVVTVSPDLTVNLGNDTTICTGSTLVLDAGHPGATYLWSTGETSQTIQPNLSEGQTTYTVAVTQGSCSGNGEIDVDVISTIPVSLGNDTTICSGSSLTLDAGYPGATYTWTTGAASQTINAAAAGTYGVTVNHNGCTGSDEIELAVMDMPTSVNLGNDTTVCFSSALVLDAGNAGASYAWSTGETTQTITASASGTYFVTVSGCGVDIYDEIVVTMGSAPAPSITQQGNELISTNADTYQWYKGGVLIPGATDKKYKPRGYGTYTVRVTIGSSGCIGEASYFFVPAGDIYIGDIRVKVTPNPGNGLAKLILSKLPSKPIKVTVYDRIGRRVLVNTIVNTVNDLNLMPFAKGEYFVELVADDKRVIIPVITQ